MNKVVSSSIFTGTISHVRIKPKKHSFILKMGCYFVPLRGSEEDINEQLRKDKIKGHFQRKNYFGDSEKDLDKSVLEKASELNGSKITGQVYLLGQIKHQGVYFSPVNFYFINTSEEEIFSYMVAEVTNTPWNEKHCYLVDLKLCSDQKKEFHVSPFNPMDMVYKWNVSADLENIKIKLGCYRKDKEFEALLNLKKNPKRVRNYFFMNLKIIFGIYMHAFILFLKKTPIYDHPKSRRVHGE